MATQTFKKIIHPCDAPIYNGRKYPVFCEIKITDGKLSITGVHGPTRGGNAMGGCGQIDMEFAHANPAHNDPRYTPTQPDELRFAPDWSLSMWNRLLEIWHDWHLNDMRAGCEHQTGPEWDTGKILTLTPLTWGDAYHKARRRAEGGEMTEQEYKQYAHIHKLVMGVTIKGHPSHPALWSEQINELIICEYLKVGKQETKTAGWVYPSEHPEGLLTKPCEACGYKYGSAWKKSELPQDVIDFLTSLPDTDRTPNWV